MSSPEELRAIARELRIDSLRMIHEAGSGHPGGSLSAAEIIACLYFEVLRFKPGSPTIRDATASCSPRATA